MRELGDGRAYRCILSEKELREAYLRESNLMEAYKNAR
jgi:hypothetical protein